MDAGAMAAARRWNDALKKLSNSEAGGGGRRRRRFSGLGVGVLRPTGLKKMNRVIENRFGFTDAGTRRGNAPLDLALRKVSMQQDRFS